MNGTVDNSTKNNHIGRNIVLTLFTIASGICIYFVLSLINILHEPTLQANAAAGLAVIFFGIAASISGLIASILLWWFIILLSSIRRPKRSQLFNQEDYKKYYNKSMISSTIWLLVFACSLMMFTFLPGVIENTLIFTSPIYLAVGILSLVTSIVYLYWSLKVKKNIKPKDNTVIGL